MIKPIADLPGWRRLALDTVESTNADAFKLAQHGDPGQVWITANRQTKGRARRGRHWVSEPGNLYATLLLIDPAPSENLVTLPLVISLALHKALVTCLPEIADGLKIKWPNDVLLNGEKLSGILLEASPDGHGRLAVVIGCGINCEHFPDDPLYPATSLLHNGTPLHREKLFDQFSLSMAHELRIWSRGAGFSIIRKEWLDRAHGVGDAIVARFPDKTISGRFLDIDHDGMLLLEDHDRHVQKISAADIFFGESAASGT